MTTQDVLPGCSLVPGCSFFDWMRLISRAELGFGTGKRRVSTSVVQHVALMTLRFADYPDGGNIRPSEARLARITRHSVTVVRKCLKRLRELNLLDMVRAHRSPGRSGGPGMPAEYRLTAPEDLWERVAYLDPDEQELIVPEGVEPPPVYHPQRRRRQAPGAIPHPAQKSPAAAPGDSPAPAVDNSASGATAPGDGDGGVRNDRVLPLESPGAAPQITGGGTPLPNQSPSHSPNHGDASQNPVAELEGSKRDAMNGHESDSHSGQVLDVAAARAILQTLPDLGISHSQRVMAAAGRQLSTNDQMIAAARLVLADRAATPPAAPALVMVPPPKRRGKPAPAAAGHQPPVILHSVPTDPPTAWRAPDVVRSTDGTLSFGDRGDQGRVTA